jgi:hypothetical protein
MGHLLPGFGCCRSIELVRGRISLGSGLLLADEGTSHLQFGFGVAGGEETEVSYFDKARGKDMQEKSAYELLYGGGHEPPSSGIVIVSCLESDVSIGEAHQPMIGNGNAVSVAAEIMINLLRPAKRLPTVDNPFFPSELS